MERRNRPLIKPAIWNPMKPIGRITTGTFPTGGLLALINAAIKRTLHVNSERIWAGIRWGRYV